MNNKGEMQKTLKSRHINMIGLGGVIGAGLFVGSGAVINSTGPAAIISYCLAGGLVVLIMRMLGELATLNPTSGSFSEYARDSVGPWLGFTVGWLYWFFWVIVIAIEAIAGAAILQYWIPDLPIWITSLIFLFIFMLTNTLSVKSFGEFEYWFSLIKVASIIIFLVIGIAYIFGLNPSGNTPGLTNLIPAEGFAPHGLLTIFTGIVIVLFSFFGTEIVTIAAAESENAAKNVSKAISTVIFRILLFYIGSIAVVVTLLPWNSTEVLGSPFVAVIDQVIGLSFASQIVNALVLVAVLSCLNSGLYTTSRMLYSLALKGEAPKFTSKLSNKGVPLFAMYSTGVFSAILILIGIYAPDTIFLYLINASGAIGLIVYMSIAISQIINRNKIGEEKLIVKMWLFPYLSYFTVGAMIVIFISMFLIESTRSQVLLTLLLTLLILIAYLFTKKFSSTKQNSSVLDSNEG